MKIIKLNTGQEVLVDDLDFDWLNQWKWVFKEGYARGVNPKNRVYMHRLILNTPKGLETDHINGNGLDNRRENLRICTHSENLKNIKKNINNTSGYTGIIWFKFVNKWRARITVNGHTHLLGDFDDIQEAIKIRKEAEIKYHGEFRRK